jgi:transcriptional regulator with XRE-family HTH domain
MCELFHMDYERLASELLRALRGKRSQAAFARRLRYRSNIVYSWESGRAFPTAARALSAAERVGVDLKQGLTGFFRKTPSWLGESSPASKQGVINLLSELKGRSSIVELAAATGSSRFAIARWLKGTAEPRLPHFLAWVEASSLRLLDFMSMLVDPSLLPCVAERWRRMQAARQAAYDEPWSQAVLRAVELTEYRPSSRPGAAWIAARLGLSEDCVQRSLELLLASGQLRLDGSHYIGVDAPRTLDTRRDPDAARPLRAFWSRVALERLEAGHAGVFAHNVFSVSNRDLDRIRELQKQYYQQVRTIVAGSEPIEAVVLLNLQLLPLQAPTKTP